MQIKNCAATTLRYMQIKNLLQLKRFFKSKDVLQSTALRLAMSHNKGLDCPEDFELMWFSVSLKSQRLLVAVVYRPPNDNSAIIEYLNTYTLRKLDELNLVPSLW